MTHHAMRSLTPFAVIFAAWTFLGEGYTNSAFIAMIFSGCGALILSLNQSETVQLSALTLNETAGYLYALAAIGAYLVMCITTRSLQIVEYNLMIMASNIVTMVLSGLAIFEKYVRTAKSPFEFTVDNNTGALLVIMAVSNICAMAFLYYANQKAQPALVALLCVSCVVYNFFKDVIYYDFEPTQQQGMGIMIVAIAQVIFLADAICMRE